MGLETMDQPAVCILLLTQNERSLEDHTSKFLDLVSHTHYPDSARISFNWTGFNAHIKQLAPLLVNGPQEEFKNFIELVLSFMKWLLIHSGRG